MRLGGADGRHDAFTHPGDDGLFGCTTHQTIDVGPHGHTSAGFQLNAVHGHRINGGFANIRVRTVDHSGVNRGSNGIENVTSGQVNGGRPIPDQINAGLLGRDHGHDHIANPSPGQEVCFKPVGGDVDARFFGGDSIDHDDAWVDFSEPHHDEVEQARFRARDHRLEPEADDVEGQAKDHQGKDAADDAKDDQEGVHEAFSCPEGTGRTLSCAS